ncbi:NAD-dependent epimerase/dehydratase family protein [Cryobacterium luteum]|uniref:SDR family NAD(P)-dependent oxidoreductase n=1 Tax=Cryobacterium luteum TaxID=1424661 RepID=A0A1H8HRK9_9MICO|nr:NAD-dependent epimerase/dehydratase family protein [Cryobacterium luteum]TFB94172.1 SDR family NAD(P)-dependent oxidoreductase [Cryobacterium luteum]SEN58697.1 Nucleoside-diphosphate-sugar epimerase [Cryobacterium luteum]
MTVLIAGCGDLGTEVGLRFARLGHPVVGLRRNASVLPPEICGQAVDLSVTKPVIPLDTDFVVIAISAGSPTIDAYRAAYLDGLRNLLDALASHDETSAAVTPRRVLLVSSTAVYDVNDGSRVDEQTPANPRPGTDSIVLEAERMLHQRLPAATVLRLAGVYGPGRERLIQQVRDGAQLSTQSRHTNRIHRDDAAAAIVHLLLRPEQPAPLYLGVDNAPVPANEVLTFLAAELGLPEPTLKPEATPQPTPSKPASRESQRGGDKLLSNQLLLRTGFTFSYPSYREGYRALLAGVGTRHP